MKKTNGKTPVVFRFGVVLLGALIISTHFMSGLYARYSTTATGSDSARVAKFSFSDGNWASQSLETAIKSMKPGEEESIQVEIQNTGEVAIQYTVQLENLTNNLPLKATMQIPAADGASEAETVSNVTISPSGSQTVNVVISWPSGENSVDYIGKTDIVRIIVTAEQID